MVSVKKNKPVRISKKLPSRLESLEDVEKISEEVAEKAGLSSDERDNLAIAVTEVAGNAIVHGNHQNPDKYVTLEFVIKEKRIEIAVKDEGDGFNPEEFISGLPESPEIDEDFETAVFSPELPDKIPEITDWHGMSLEEVLDELYNGRYYCRKGGIHLGKVFWKAVLKGSWQGADWLARTLAESGNSSFIKEMLAKWH